ncbi:hypothetical protein F4813DRAFT_373072 [Daldinia decipiens]|uniref:uncharacterized protein n=1 Tax=Daldinia decipiens TaxID=326647 RepID=UPI0020C51B5A|nr:uncharacterized protein F4813DRAFT_373072 [Daldinia decipiens]KAI1653873.1 hypothetical protein F4813DRAFT_373072 [Daldinia decipiens]
MATGWFGAMPPPPGVEANLIDPPTQMKQNIALHTVCLTLASFSVVIRLYTRIYISGGKLGIEDYLCILSWALSVTFSGLMFAAYSKGIGRHIWDTPAVWIVGTLKIYTIATFIYLILSTCIKLTFLFLYRRIFSPQTKSKYFIYGAIYFVVCLNTALLFTTIFECSPVARSWNSALDGHCINPKILPYLSGVTSFLTDIYILILPIPLLWHLNMGRKRKFRLIAIFGTGLFACVSSVIRLAMTPVLSSSLDATWNISNITVWGTLEVNIGIICACAVALPAFFDRHLPEWAKLSMSRLRLYTRSFPKGTKGSNSATGDVQNQWQSYTHLEESGSMKLVIQGTEIYALKDTAPSKIVN